MIVLHVGLRKAGSSTIQKFLSDNRKALLKKSFEYPEIGLKGLNHHRIAWEVVDRVKTEKSVKKTVLLNELVAHWRQSRASTLMMSAESFEDTTPEGIVHLRKQLESCRTGEPIKIVLILRDLVELMPSSYAQKVKYGRHTYDFDEFYAIRMTQERVDYFRTAERWADVFGWENLIVRPLDPGHLHNGSLIDDIFHRLKKFGKIPDISHLDHRIVRNQRAGWRVLEAVRALYTGTHGLATDHLAVKRLAAFGSRKRLGKMAFEVGSDIGWNCDKGNYLTRQQAEDCLRLYREAIESLNARVADKLPAPKDLDARGFVERQSPHSAQTIPPTDLVAFYNRLSERLIETSKIR